MVRSMIDTTHDGLPAALSAIRGLLPGDCVALYDTGSAGIDATPADWDQIPSGLMRVSIDQGFTGSPNMNATVRDCENGAWSLSQAVNRQGWNVPRPTLYLGYPDTVQLAYEAGWRGDVWIAHPGPMPSVPVAVPQGMTMVAEQWNYTNPAYDRSVIFDPYWPMKGQPVNTPTPPADPPTAVPATLPVEIQTEWRWCHKCQSLFYGPNQAKSVCAAGGTHEGTSSWNYLVVGVSA